MTEQNSTTTPKKRRGFACLSPEARAEIARKGGLSAHARHRFTSDEAREAGRKGGAVTSADREHMSRIAQKGGIAARDRRKSSDEGDDA